MCQNAEMKNEPATMRDEPIQQKEDILTGKNR